MIQTESILRPQEVQLCLILHCLIEDLAILMAQSELLDSSQQNHLRIILP
jgi:hypothetical protein